MLNEERRREILELLRKDGRVLVRDLSKRFRISLITIRKDLEYLHHQGMLERTHGGALLAGHIYEPFRFDASFHVREQRFAPEKRRIAMAAADLVLENETIGFTAGTTTTQVARVLRLRTGLHVVTNAVNIGMELNTSETLETTLTGGCLRWPGASPAWWSATCWPPRC